MMTISYALKTPEYVLSVGRLDYYNREGSGLDSFGFWYGTGATALGLTGKVDPETLRNLFRGMSVDGSTPMVRNAGHKDRQGGWDLTFSIPKSFSVAWAIGSKEERQAIEAAHIAGVEKALAEIERLAGWTRLPGSKGKEFEKVRLTFARFMHGTSRESDPDLHTHCLLINVGLLANGQTAFVYTRDLFRMKMLAGLIYRQTVAHEVRKGLGYELRQKRTWMEIAGIPEEVCHWFSKRRQQVLEHMAARGRTDAKSAAEAAKATRRGKESIPREELHTRWREIAQRALGFSPDIITSLRKPYRRSKEPMGLHRAIDSLLKERSHFTERQFLRRVLELNQAAGHSYDAILKGVRRAIPGLVDLGVQNRERYLTTHAVYREEKLLMEKAARGRESTGHLVPERRIRRAGKALSESQREALRHITGKPGQMAVLQGLAGTGKSSLLAAAKTVWKESGYRVLGGAYSGKAAQGLEESSKIQSHTVDRLLNQWSKAQSSVRPLDARTVLVIDEAGMIDTDKMHRLFNAVLKAGAKLVLVGDEKQLPPVFGSAPFAMLGQELGRSELTEIRRQRNPLLRHIVEELAEGSPKAALAMLKRCGLLNLHRTSEEARAQLVADWSKSGSPRDHLMLAGTRNEVADLNKRAQDTLNRAGKLGFQMFTANGIGFRMGDRVLCSRNDLRLGVRNGSLGELTAFNPFTRIATLRLDNKKSVYIPLKDYSHLDLGYCLTVHRAQGMTSQSSFILWSSQMQSREMTYVQASRARDSSRFYLTPDQAGHDFADALKDMERSVAKDLAIQREKGRSREPGLSHSL